MTRFTMKLKAPEGVGDPCIAGVTLASRDGCYEVEAEVGALLIECFGFVPAEAGTIMTAAPAEKSRRGRARARTIKPKLD
jgi:hypothetical protein